MAREPLDPYAQRTIVEALRRGHFMDTAASLAGVTTARVHTCLRLGADPDSAYADFAVEVRQALAHAEDTALGFLQEQVATGDLKAVTWFLERRYPERWAPKIQHVVRQEVDGILDRIESLEHELGADVIARVLGAVAGEHGVGTGEVEEEEGEGLH